MRRRRTRLAARAGAIGDDATLDFALPVHPVTVTALYESGQPVKGAGLQGSATSS